MSKNKIVIEFDDAKDAAEVLHALSKYIELSWNYETKKAMIVVDAKTMKVLVSKSINESPKPLRL